MIQSVPAVQTVVPGHSHRGGVVPTVKLTVEIIIHSTTMFICFYSALLQPVEIDNVDVELTATVKDGLI